MMIEKLDARHRRIIALSILGCVILAVLSVTVLPVWLINANYQSELDQLHDRLQRYQAITSQDPELRRRYTELARAQSSRGHFLNSDSDATAAAELQRIIKEISAANGTQLLSTQIMPATNDGGMVRIALRVRMTGPLPGIMESVYSLESNGVFLFLENFSLRQGAGRRMRSITAIDTFEANFDLVAYMQELT